MGDLQRARATLRLSSQAREILWFVSLVVAGGWFVSVVGLRAPFLMGGFLGLLILLTAVWSRRPRALPKLFLISLAVILAGYAIVGRGFAHIGVAPIFYVGEIVLFLGCLATILGGGIRPAFRSPILRILLVFMVWCALQTLPYFRQYGLDALRDAATWGYGVFAFFVTGFLLRRGQGSLHEVLGFYRRIGPWIVILIALLMIVGRTWHPTLVAPGMRVNFFNGRPGPMSVQLAGVGIFLTLGLHRLRRTGARSAKPWDMVLFSVWLLVAMTTAILNRGGMLSILMAFSCVLFVRPSRQFLRATAVAAAIFGVLLVANPQISLEAGREYNPRQLVVNFLSVFDEASEEGMSATREWRLRWWRDILDYTVFGPHFWFGKGFGVNLALSDGIVEAQDEEGYPLRSPHNGHMTILARAGVPGFVLWLVILGVFAISMLRGYFRSRSGGRDWQARLYLWVLGFWVAFLTNMSFTVYLEGPHGGIWFWSLMGFGIALLEWDRSPMDAVGGRPHAIRRSTYAPPWMDRYTPSRIS